ncbi:hypothetical protein I552_0002 [Mycobacterium xenopi 3993]|nr:hypothetical protein I552_0002 [Mycobacterium xenopi 3993]
MPPCSQGRRADHLRRDSDAADELHVHSVPDHKFAVAAGPNQSSYSRSTSRAMSRSSCIIWTAPSPPSKCARDGGSAADVLAHGLGGSSDLPVPYAYAVVGAAWALTFTFALVAFAWRRPRFDPFAPGRPLPQ